MISGTLAEHGIRADRNLARAGTQFPADAVAPSNGSPPQFAAATKTPFESGAAGDAVCTCKWYVPVKRCFDLMASLALLVIAIPILVVAAVVVKLTSRGPAFYRQVRVGLDGRTFTLIKLRTMRHNAEAETGPVWSTGNDPRITRVGELLRRTHIDEFPQLLNVLCGQMSLVGPRPERPEFVARLEREIAHYPERLKVRPGITGLAQMRLPADSSVESVRRKVIHDLYYVQHASPWLDFKLLCMTAWRLVSEIGSFCSKTFAVPTSREIERNYRRAVNIAAIEPASEMLPAALGPVPNRAVFEGFPEEMVAFWDVE